MVSTKFHSLVFSLRGRAGRNQSPVMWPVRLWHTASWASSWGSLPLLSPAFRRSHFRRQVPVWARNCPVILPKFWLPRKFKGLLHATNLWHGTDGFTSPLNEGALRIFFALKIWRLRPGLNPRTWILKASTLPLDHRKTFHNLNFIINVMYTYHLTASLNGTHRNIIVLTVRGRSLCATVTGGLVAC
jgi:hypothetical protein